MPTVSSSSSSGVSSPFTPEAHWAEPNSSAVGKGIRISVFFLSTEWMTSDEMTGAQGEKASNLLHMQHWDCLRCMEINMLLYIQRRVLVCSCM